MADNRDGHQRSSSSSRAVSLLQEATKLLTDSTDMTSASIVGSNTNTASSSNNSAAVMQNFRHLFSPYKQNAGSSQSAYQSTKKRQKPFFQVKETWTHEFFCLATCCQTHCPSRTEKLELQDAGLGRKKICFHSKATGKEFSKKLTEHFPKLSDAGGFELLRNGQPMVVIKPPGSGYSVPFLRDNSGLGQAICYIRPLQKDLALDENVSDDDEETVSTGFVMATTTFLLTVVSGGSERSWLDCNQ